MNDWLNIRKIDIKLEQNTKKYDSDNNSIKLLRFYEVL
jgi:hypothetical protein